MIVLKKKERKKESLTDFVNGPAAFVCQYTTDSFVGYLGYLGYFWSKLVVKMSSRNVKFDSIISLCGLGDISVRTFKFSRSQSSLSPLMFTVFINT